MEGEADNFRGLFHVLTSPVRFFRARRAEPPSWVVAMTPVVLHCGLVSIASALAVRKGQSALAPALARAGVDAGDALLGIGLTVAAVSAFGLSWVAFALHSAAFVVLDVLLVGSGRARRLVEFAAYAHVPAVVWAAVSVVVLAGWWNPDALRVPTTISSSDLSDVIADYQRRLSAEPLPIALRTVARCVGLWLVALEAAAFHVVSGATFACSVLCGLGVAGLLVVLPWFFGG